MESVGSRAIEFSIERKKLQMSNARRTVRLSHFVKAKNRNANVRSVEQRVSDVAQFFVAEDLVSIDVKIS